MTPLRWLWAALILLYLGFFGWYTSFGGPLTDAEIDHYLALMDANGLAADPEVRARLEYFMKTDTGDDFVMLNVIDMYETPQQIDGVEPGETSAEVLGKYTAFMYPALFARASHPVLFGTAASQAMDLMNAAGMESWTQAAGMRYRSRRDMLEIASNPAFQGSHAFKVAAMRKTIAFPLDPWIQPGDPRLLLGLVLALLGCALSWLLSVRRTAAG